MLQITDVSVRVAGRTLIDKSSMRVDAGKRVGLIGRNGTGKSTLLKVIAGELGADDGECDYPSRWRIGLTRQEAPASDDKLIDIVLSADTERTSLIEQSERVEDPAKLAHIHERLRDIDAASAPARAARILFGLGFDEESQHRPAREFSGGWRMRVSLAALLFTKPDLLLLDEPTNHLDVEAAMWLEDFLRAYDGTMLLVSHDRYMLNRVVQEVVHLENHRLTSYKGNYDFFEKTRAQRLELEAKQRERQLTQRAHIMSFVDRFRYKASKARQAQSRLKMLERMQPIAAALADPSVNIEFPAPNPLASPLVTWDDLQVGYDKEAPIFKRLSLRFDADDRIALLGANGNGKSTLIKVLAQRLAPMAGQIQKSSKLKVGYFAQHQADELNVEDTPFKTLERLMPKANEAQVRAQLGKFGYGEDKADTKIASLSGGEKARLLLALITRDNPHLILLDEPTNHLDVDSRQALVQAINAFDGAVIIVSHDTHLLQATTDQLWLVDGGKVKSFDGDLEDYRRHLASIKRHANPQRAQDLPERAAPSPSDDSRDNRKDARKASAERRALLAPLKKAAESAEKRVEKLQADKAKIESVLADPRLYEPQHAAKAAEATRLSGDIAKKLEEAELAWLEALEALEVAEQS